MNKLDGLFRLRPFRVFHFIRLFYSILLFISFALVLWYVIKETETANYWLHYFSFLL